MSEVIRIALVQMDSRDDVEENLKKAEQSIRLAKEGGAHLVAFPEFMNFLPFARASLYDEPEDGRTTRLLQSLAREYGIVIHAGSILVSSGTDKPYNQSFIVDRDGALKCRYTKLHLFDTWIPEGKGFWESELYTPGEVIATAQILNITVGTAICYDLRFPDLFRLMTLNGARIIFVPGNFSRSTGEDFLEAMLRTRALENGVYIVSANQVGMKKKSFSYGHSMVIAPDGQVVAVKEAGEGLLFYDLDPVQVDRQRQHLPLLAHAREDVYQRYRARLSAKP